MKVGNFFFQDIVWCQVDYDPNFVKILETVACKSDVEKSGWKTETL